MASYDLCILVPAYDEGQRPLEFVVSILEKFGQICPELKLAFIIIDDGSKAAPVTLPDDLSDDLHLSVFRLRKNLGKDFALYYGLKNSPVSRFYASIDGDGEQPPELLVKQWSAVVSGNAEIITAYRKSPVKNEGFFKRINRACIRFLSRNLSSFQIDGLTDCVMFSHKVKRTIIKTMESNKLISIVPWRILFSSFFEPEGSIEFTAISVEKTGGSRFTNWELFRLGLKCFVLNPRSLVKIIYASLILLLFISALPVAFVVWDWVNGNLYQGYMTVVTLLAIIFWAALLLIALLLSRLIVEMRLLQHALELD